MGNSREVVVLLVLMGIRETKEFGLERNELEVSVGHPGGPV